MIKKIILNKQLYKMFKNESLYFCQQQQIQQNPKGILICTKKNFQMLFLSAYQCQGLLSQTEG